MIPYQLLIENRKYQLIQEILNTLIRRINQYQLLQYNDDCALGLASLAIAAMQDFRLSLQTFI